MKMARKIPIASERLALKKSIMVTWNPLSAGERIKISANQPGPWKRAGRKAAGPGREKFSYKYRVPLIRDRAEFAVPGSSAGN